MNAQYLNVLYVIVIRQIEDHLYYYNSLIGGFLVGRSVSVVFLTTQCFLSSNSGC